MNGIDRFLQFGTVVVRNDESGAVRILFGGQFEWGRRTKPLKSDDPQTPRDRNLCQLLLRKSRVQSVVDLLRFR